MRLTPILAVLDVPTAKFFWPPPKTSVTWGGPDTYRSPSYVNISSGRLVYKSLNCKNHLSIWYQRRGQYFYTSLTGQAHSSLRQELLGATAQLGEPGGRRTFPTALVQSMHEHRLAGRRSVRGRESTRASGGTRHRSHNRRQARLTSFRDSRRRAHCSYRGWRRDVRDSTKPTLVSCPRPPQRVRASHTSCRRFTTKLRRMHNNYTSRSF